ncbi:MAG: hypothetical protein IT165_01795 [Bryobacterales bacterium]|nr:hypothetical protein [Bryobacterales bacterium]
MDSVTQTLMAKIKTLNETVWERHASEPAIADWLDNFAAPNPPEPSERLHALYLLSNFMYFGNRQIRELLKHLYRDLYRYPILRDIRRANADTLDSDLIDPFFKTELAKTRFLGVGNPSESGCHLLYYFRQENGLSKDLFIHTHELFRREPGSNAQQLRDPDVTRYVFIDDFCGSGKQASQYSRDLVEDILRLNPNASVAYYVLFATTKGITTVRSETAFTEAREIYQLDPSFECFSAGSRYFLRPADGIDKQFCQEMCQRYGAHMVAPAHVLGFDNSQLLLGFHHNTPDNTLPIIWYDEPSDFPWKPIFRRYPKLEW